MQFYWVRSQRWKHLPSPPLSRLLLFKNQIVKRWKGESDFRPFWGRQAFHPRYWRLNQLNSFATSLPHALFHCSFESHSLFLDRRNWTYIDSPGNDSQFCHYFTCRLLNDKKQPTAWRRLSSRSLLPPSSLRWWRQQANLKWYVAL